jgi:hypothetical protein
VYLELQWISEPALLSQLGGLLEGPLIFALRWLAARYPLDTMASLID